MKKAEPDVIEAETPEAKKKNPYLRNAEDLYEELLDSLARLQSRISASTGSSRRRRPKTGQIHQ